MPLLSWDKSLKVIISATSISSEVSSNLLKFIANECSDKTSIIFFKVIFLLETANMNMCSYIQYLNDTVLEKEAWPLNGGKEIDPPAVDASEA